MVKGWKDDMKEETMTVLVGKGDRFMLLQAGNSKEFIPAFFCLLKKNEEYYKEINHDMFCNRFKDSLIKNLKKSSVIIIDNASYHSKVLDKAATMSSRPWFSNSKTITFHLKRILRQQSYWSLFLYTNHVFNYT